VVDANSTNIAAGTATGIVFDAATAEGLDGAVQRALALFRDRRSWKKIQLTGMRQDFSWRHSAAEYLRLYEMAIDDARQHATAARMHV
jgi:starch synthase